MNAYPGPFKCPDCLEWWAGFAHRCATPGITIATGGSTTVKCVCEQKGKTKALVVCPVHDLSVTYYNSSTLTAHRTDP